MEELYKLSVEVAKAALELARANAKCSNCKKKKCNECNVYCIQTATDKLTSAIISEGQIMPQPEIDNINHFPTVTEE